MNDHWGEDNRFPVADWQHEVASGDTRLGYADWVANQHSNYGDVDENGDIHYLGGTLVAGEDF